VAFSPNGQMLATGDRNGGLCIWDPDNGQELFTLGGHKSAVTGLSWRGDSKLLASASEDGTVKLWETKEGKQTRSWAAHGGGTLSIAYAHEGGLVSCGRDNVVTLWSGNGGKERSMEGALDLPLRAVFSFDGKRVFASDFGGHIGVWSAADGKRIGELNAKPAAPAAHVASAR